MMLPEQISEAAFQRQVIDLASVCGWLCSHYSDARKQVRRGGRVIWIGDAAAAGFPDLTLARAPRVIFAELKSGTGRLRPLQRLWVETLQACPGVEAYVWRPSDWPEIQQLLSRPTPPLAGGTDGNDAADGHPEG